MNPKCNDIRLVLHLWFLSHVLNEVWVILLNRYMRNDVCYYPVGWDMVAYICFKPVTF